MRTPLDNNLQTGPKESTYHGMKGSKEDKMKHNSLKFLGMTALLTLAGVAGAATAPSGPMTDSDIAAKAAHEIRMYPRYTIWDNVDIRVKEGSLELLGQVSVV